MLLLVFTVCVVVPVAATVPVVMPVIVAVVVMPAVAVPADALAVAVPAAAVPAVAVPAVAVPADALAVAVPADALAVAVLTRLRVPLGLTDPQTLFVTVAFCVLLSAKARGVQQSSRRSILLFYLYLHTV